MTIDLIDILLFLAAGQALLLSLLIFHKHRQLYATPFLEFMLFCYALILVHLILRETGLYSIYPHLYPQLIGLSFLIGPLHYLYARYLITFRRRLQKRDWLHFVPFILYQGYLSRYFFKSAEEILIVIRK